MLVKSLMAAAVGAALMGPRDAQRSAGGGAVATRKNTLPANWEAQMAQDAAKGRKQVAKLGTSQRLKTSGGVLTYMDAPVPGNRMEAVMLAAAFENTYYEGDYDPQATTPPVCFALAKTADEDDSGMVPHPEAPKKQAASCAECKHNKFGSAEKGRGKACKNGVHIALIHADALKKKDVDSAEVVTLSVPPTSLPLYKTYVKEMEQLSNRPMYGFVSEIALTPRPAGGFFVNLHPVKEIDKKVLGDVFAKAKQAEKAVDERPPFPKEEEAAPKGKAAKGGQQKRKKY